MNQKQLKKMMEQAQRMQAGVLKAQDDLAKERVEGSAADGLVRAVVTGQGELVDLTISPETLDPDDVEMLEDLILVAVKDAVSRSKKLSEDRINALGLPGLGGLM